MAEQFFLDQPELEHLRISERAAVKAILRDMKAENEFGVLSLKQRDIFILTKIVGLSDEHVFLDIDQDRLINEMAMGQECLYSRTLNKIKIQCLLGQPTLSDYQGAQAFRFPIPTSVLKLQRRECYRLYLPENRVLDCQIGEGRHAVLDLSVSGLTIATKLPLWEEGAILENCSLLLPGAGKINFTLSVRHKRVIQQHEIDLYRYGCRFEDPKSHMETVIQRFIMLTEQELRVAAAAKS